jgi:hypothetical protein
VATDTHHHHKTHQDWLLYKVVSWCMMGSMTCVSAMLSKTTLFSNMCCIVTVISQEKCINQNKSKLKVIHVEFYTKFHKMMRY